MVLRCKTLNFHIFEKIKIEKNLKKNSKIPRLQLITKKFTLRFLTYKLKKQLYFTKLF